MQGIDLTNFERTGLNADRLLAMYRMMVVTRQLDERMILLHRMSKVPFVVSGIGQEAAQIGAAFAFDPKVDYAFPYYRDYGFVLAFGQTPTDILLHSFAKADDPNSGGRQMVGHFGGKRFHIVSQSSPTGSQVPQAAGLAYAAKLRGEPAVVYVSFGEGASSQGDCHEGMNFAGIHQLPVVFICMNNQYALSTPVSLQVAGGSIAERAAGYGFPGVTVDGTDPIAMYEATRTAVERARRGEGPTLIEAKMYRLKAHSGDDDHLRYRKQEEVDEASTRDPLPMFRDALLHENLLTLEQDAILQAEVAELIQEATEAADRAPNPRPEDALLHVYAQGGVM